MGQGKVEEQENCFCCSCLVPKLCLTLCHPVDCSTPVEKPQRDIQRDTRGWQKEEKERKKKIVTQGMCDRNQHNIIEQLSFS